VSLTTGEVNLAAAVIGAVAVLGAALIQRRGSPPPVPDTVVSTTKGDPFRALRPPTQPSGRRGIVTYAVIIGIVLSFVAGSVVILPSSKRSRFQERLVIRERPVFLYRCFLSLCSSSLTPLGLVPKA
jgi:hypothetical protein